MTNPADMIRIADKPDALNQHEARMILDNLAQAQRALSAYKAPRLGAVFADDAHQYDHPADAGTRLVCPWCQKEGASIVAHDAAYRQNHPEDFDMATEVITFDYDGDAEFGDTTHYTVECCNLPVSLPEGWEEV